MQKPSEKQGFSQRLKQALKRSPKNVKSGTELALQFNLRHPDSVSPQAAQKWLSGQAMPTPEKIDVLAEWLSVSAQWLRYGIAEDKPSSPQTRRPSKAKGAIQPTEEEMKLLARIRNLPEHHRYIVMEIVEQFSLEQEMWRE